MKEAVNHLSDKLKQQGDAQTLPNGEDDPINDTISYTERLLRLRQSRAPRDGALVETLSHDLTALLNEKDAGLALTCETIIDDEQPTPEKKRLLFNIMLVVRSLVAPHENVDLSVAEMSEAISLSCMFRGKFDGNNVEARNLALNSYKFAPKLALHCPLGGTRDPNTHFTQRDGHASFGQGHSQASQNRRLHPSQRAGRCRKIGSGACDHSGTDARRRRSRGRALPDVHTRPDLSNRARPVLPCGSLSIVRQLGTGGTRFSGDF